MGAGQFDKMGNSNRGDLRDSTKTNIATTAQRGRGLEREVAGKQAGISH